MSHGLILAGGEGSRLAADGVTTPKALVPVAGRAQILNLIEILERLGCESITCMVREGVRVEAPASVAVRACRTPSSLHTLVAGLAVVPPGPVFCTMVDTVMPLADWRFVYGGVTDQLRAGSFAVLAVTPYVDDERPVYVARDAAGRAIEIADSPRNGTAPVVVTGGVYGFSPGARRLASVAVTSESRMRAFLKLLIAVRAPITTVEVAKIIDLDHKRDLEAAERWLDARASEAPR
ncbi:MAG TPA: NTP transferase domain-containing protein [Gemmatimonadales bacterium]|nr:NTP transferase domain-containing protein [Gemmatimonadales bacterium]